MSKTEDQQPFDWSPIPKGLLESTRKKVYESWSRNHCIKCGSDKLDIRYSQPDDMLDYTCLQCRRKWRQKTLDNLRKDELLNSQGE